MRVYPPNKDGCLHHHRAVTDILKGRILEARGLGLTHDEISVELDIPRSTVASFLQRFQEHGSEENLRSTGRPPRPQHGSIATEFGLPLVIPTSQTLYCTILPIRVFQHQQFVVAFMKTIFENGGW